MCKVKSGILIKNKNDVQNLIIAIINRQKDIYRKEIIYNMVEYHFRESEVDLSREMLRIMIDENLMFLYRKGFINCQNGYYSPQSITERDDDIVEYKI